MGGANLVRASLDHNVGRFIYFQTALCYGTKPLHNPITLQHPKLPANSSYAISKTAAEDYLEISGLNYVSFRLANVIGPRNVSGPLPIFYQRLFSGETVLRHPLAARLRFCEGSRARGFKSPRWGRKRGLPLFQRDGCSDSGAIRPCCRRNENSAVSEAGGQRSWAGRCPVHSSGSKPNLF